MQDYKIKTYHIPSYMIEAMKLDMELEDINQRFNAIKAKLESIKKKKKEHDDLLLSASMFKLFIHKCYPKEIHSDLLKALWDQFNCQEIESMDELRDIIGAILFRIYFSKGEDKVFDLNDPDFYDDEKCQRLYDQEIFIPANWLDQFIRCLIKKNAEEDMILHNLTPEWLWPHCFTLLLELYKLTAESIKNEK